MSGSQDTAARNGGAGNGHAAAAEARNGLLWRLQSLLRRREAESVRYRMEELIEEQDEPSREGALESADGLNPHERALLGNVLKLRGKTASDVMVPRADIMAMPEDFTLEQAIRLIQRDGHSRYPVYRGQLDEIVGMVHIKDVFAAVGREGAFDMKAILRTPLLVVPSIPVLDLLLQMRQARIHMALVVDEYGGVAGLATLNDILSEVAGDLTVAGPEHPAVVRREDGSWLVDGALAVEALRELLGLEERRGDPREYRSVGGWIFTALARVPTEGDHIDAEGHRLEVVDMDGNRIDKVLVQRIPN
jgi:magnesium and cobalt transporter